MKYLIQEQSRRKATPTLSLMLTILRQQFSSHIFIAIMGQSYHIRHFYFLNLLPNIPHTYNLDLLVMVSLLLLNFVPNFYFKKIISYNPTGCI